MRRFWNWLSRFDLPSRGTSHHHFSASGWTCSALHLEALETRNVLAAGVLATYAVTENWGSGFQAQIQLANQQSTSVPNWQLAFDYAANITSIWDARIISHTGTHYVIGNAGWNSTIAAGGQASFGFVASPGGSNAAPTNYQLNGVALGGTSTPPVPTLSIGDVSVTEDNTNTKTALFTVSLSAPATTSVTVAYATANATALAGSDYQATSGILTFAAGQMQKSITVPIIGDTKNELDETFNVVLSSPTGATLARAQGIGTIKDDDVAPSTGDFQFQVTTNWGSGFTGTITIRNSGQTPITNWQIEFDFASRITGMWNASIVSQTGSHYVVKNAIWNSTIAPGATSTFGFNATPGGTVVPPTNYRFSGGSGGGGGNVNHAPTAGNDSAITNTGQAVVINLLANDTDPDGDPLTVAAIGLAQNGTVLLGAGGNATYTPKAGFTGTDSFTYTIGDGKGATAAGVVSVVVSAPTTIGAWPAHFYAPYVDMTLYPTYNLVTAAQTQGIKYFTLAFIVADSHNNPSWGGYDVYGVNGSEFDMAVRQQITSLRALGGDVMVSFGGAANQELAEVITNVSQLTSAYQTVVTTYGLTHLDFDIEGAAMANHASVDRRSQAIAALQQNAAATGRSLDVWFTLPVLPTGLTADGIYLLQSALRYGVKIGGVNIMTMDYGDSAAPNPQGHMGDYSIQAAQSLFGQLQGLYGASKTTTQLWQMIGVTPMIGVNDVTSEVFDQAAARQVLAHAKQMGMGRISMWSLNRDQGSTSKPYPDNISSSIVQQPFEFSTIFNGING